MVEIPKEMLARWCALPSLGRAYLRPLLCRGRVEAGGVFLIGLNPATPIGPDEFTPEKYRELIGDYAGFMRYYGAARLRLGKRRLKSNTRIGIEALGDWLFSIAGNFPVETNVVAYPTKDEPELRRVPRQVVAQGEQVFLELVGFLTPRLLVFHGKSSLRRALRLLPCAGFAFARAPDLRLRIREMELSSPVAKGTWPDGTKAAVMACRHLKVYGEQGKTFGPFRERLQAAFEAAI